MRKLRLERCSVFLMLFSVLFLSRVAFADEVILANGDRLTGTITEIKENVLILETDYSDEYLARFAGG